MLLLSGNAVQIPAAAGRGTIYQRDRLGEPIARSPKTRATPRREPPVRRVQRFSNTAICDNIDARQYCWSASKRAGIDGASCHERAI